MILWRKEHCPKLSGLSCRANPYFEKAFLFVVRLNKTGIVSDALIILGQKDRNLDCNFEYIFLVMYVSKMSLP